MADREKLKDSRQRVGGGLCLVRRRPAGLAGAGRLRVGHGDPRRVAIRAAQSGLRVGRGRQDLGLLLLGLPARRLPCRQQRGLVGAAASGKAAYYGMLPIGKRNRQTIANPIYVNDEFDAIYFDGTSVSTIGDNNDGWDGENSTAEKASFYHSATAHPNARASADRQGQEREQLGGHRGEHSLRQLGPHRRPGQDVRGPQLWKWPRADQRGRHPPLGHRLPRLPPEQHKRRPGAGRLERYGARWGPANELRDRTKSPSNEPQWRPSPADGHLDLRRQSLGNEWSATPLRHRRSPKARALDHRLRQLDGLNAKWLSGSAVEREQRPI